MKNKFSATISVSRPKIFLFGTILGIISSTVLIFIFAFILTICDLGEAAAFPCSSVSMGLGGFIGAFYSAKKIGEKGYVCGLLIAIIMLVISTIVSMFLNGFNFTEKTLLRALIVVIMSMLGGIIGINKKTKSLVK